MNYETIIRINIYDLIAGDIKLINKIAAADYAGTAQATSAAGAAKTGSTGNFSQTLKNAVSKSEDLDDIFTSAADKYGVDVNLLKAVAKAESGFKTDAVSSCGAEGVMQLMPSTASSLGVSDAFDPAQNIDGGAKYLSGLLNKYGSTTLALAAYNAGSGNVDKYGGVPPFEETQNYVKRVLSYAGQDITAGSANTSSASYGTQQPQNTYSTDSTGSSVSDLLSIGSADLTQDDYMLLLNIFAQALKQNAISGAIDNVSNSSSDLSGSYTV